MQSNTTGEQTSRNSNSEANNRSIRGLGRIRSTTPRRRRSSVSPPRYQNGNGNNNRRSANVNLRVRSTHPNAAFVTPPAQQRLNVRELFGDFAGFVAPPLTGSTSNGNNNNDNTTNNNNSERGSGWLGSALARTPRRSTNNNTSDTDFNSSGNNLNYAASSADGNAAATSQPSTPRSRKSKVLKGFRQGSIGSLLRLDNDRNSGANADNNNNPNESGLPVGGGTSNNIENNNASALNEHPKLKALKIRRHHILQMTKRLQQQHSKRFPHAEVLAVLEFWRMCPTEVTLKMLAYLGPQLISKLQRTQRNIHHLLEYDVSWRVLCEELYKWRPGDAEPDSWKEHYRLNPCVPVDFSSIGLALAVVGTGWSPKQYKRYCKSSSAQCPEIQNNMTIWLRPDEPHLVPQAISISTLRRSTMVTLQTMRTRENLDEETDAPVAGLGVLGGESQENPNPPEECHPDAVGEALNNVQEEDGEDDSSAGSSAAREEEEEDDDDDEVEEIEEDEDAPIEKKKTRAVVQSKTRRRNEPLFRVLRGHLILKEVELEHSCLGTDIWNGNACVQIQPIYLHASGNILSLTPSATTVIQQSAVKSTSGRGIVTVDGGQLICEGSYIHDCAATGVYVGGRGSCAHLTNTDVWSNGTGNPNLAGGIARGHSGVYVEQAKKVELDHCTVAYNTASGISMIGSAQLPAILNRENPDSNQTLMMTHTSVLSNGCTPIDMPHTAFGGGDLPNQHQFPWQLPDRHNRIAVVGAPQAQSIPLLEELKRQKEEMQQKKKGKKKGKTGVATRSSSWASGTPWNFNNQN